MTEYGLAKIVSTPKIIVINDEYMLEVLIKNQKKTKKLDKLSSANLDRLVRSKARSEICSVVLRNLIWKEEMKEIHITIILVLKNKC